MESWYPVYWNGRKAGEVTVTRQGLYYVFSCRVQLPPKDRYRLYAHTEGACRDLGLCVPDGNGAALQTRIPVKYFALGEYRFCLNQPIAGEFVPISSDRPFPAMDRLERGKFTRFGDKPGIVFPVREKRSDNL